MTLRRFFIFFGICAAAFVIGWWVVPTVFVTNVPKQALPEVDLSYKFECENDPVKCADEMAKMSATSVEYSPTPADQQAAANDLIWTGTFAADQVPFKSGENWLGLFREGGKYAVRQTKLNITGSKTPGAANVEVTTSRQGRSLFLVRNMAYLREGDITTVRDEETTEQALMPLNSAPRTFELAGKSYAFTVEAQQDGRLVKGSKLVLTVGNDRQILRVLDTECGDCAWNILWAGDLDRDSKLDFLMDLPDQPNTTEKVLFLSSQPIGGKLVKSVASLRLSL